MGAGSFVFPLAVVGFLAYIAAFVLTNPAAPAPFLSVQPGDEVTYEATLYYGEDYAAFTSHEEQLSTLKASPYGLLRRQNELRITMPDNASAITDPTLQQFLGKRVGETFTTPPTPNLFGDWRVNVTARNVLVTQPVDVTLTGDDVGGLRQAATQQLRREPQIGDELACEVGTCRILALNATSATYRRLVVDGTELPSENALQVPSGYPHPKSGLALKTLDASRFAIVWAPVAGDKFLLSAPAGSVWPEGAYHFRGGDSEFVDVQYAPAAGLTFDGARAPAHLLGETAWYEITIVRLG